MSRSSTRINNINKWSEKINLLITNFTLYEPECDNYKKCNKKITSIYGQIQLYINDPRLIYTNNPLDVFILPELESDKKYNEVFNKILDYYYTPLFSEHDLKNPIYLQLVIDYRDLLKKTTLIKIDNCRDKYDILENLKTIQTFPELDVKHMNKKPQVDGQKMITDYYKSQSKSTSQKKLKPQSQIPSTLSQTNIKQYYKPIPKAKKTLSSKDKGKISSYFKPIQYK
jgi:hypothetical protein